MRFEQLEYLIEVSKHRTFAAASEALFIAPQSLSRSIATIEQEVGQPLLKRSAKGICFTSAGEIYLEMARKILQEYYTTMDLLCNANLNQKFHQDLQGDLYLYSYSIFMDTILGNVIHSFKKTYPFVNIFPLSVYSNLPIEEIVNQSEKKILLSVYAVNADFARMEAINDMNNIQSFRISELRGEYYACCHKKCPLAQQKEVSLKVVTQYPVIKFTSSNPDSVQSEDMISRFIYQNYYQTYDRQIAFATDSLIEWISAIKHNVGVGLLYQIAFSETSVIKELFQDMAIIRIRERPTVEPVFYTSNHPSPATLCFIQYFIKMFKQ